MSPRWQQDTLHILPDADRVENMMATHMRERGLRAVDASSWKTLAELEAELAAPLLAGSRLAAEATRRYLIGRLLQDLPPPSHDRPSARTPGYRRALSTALAELGVPPRAQLERAVAALPRGPVAERLAFLLELRGRLEAALRERHLFDPAQRRRAALMALDPERALPALLEGRRLVVFAHILDFGPWRRRLVLALARRLVPVHGRVRLRLPRVPLGGFLEPAVRAFESANLPIEIDWQLPPSPPRRAPTLVAFSPGAEARAVIEQAASAGAEGEVAIVLPPGLAEGGSFVAALEREARVRGLEIHSRRAQTLSTSLPGRVLLLAHALLDEDIPNEGLIRLLVAINPRSPVPVERIARMLRVSGARRDLPAGTLSATLADLAERAGSTPFRREELQQAARLVAGHTALLRSLQAPGTPQQWVERHHSLCTGLGLNPTSLGLEPLSTASAPEAALAADEQVSALTMRALQELHKTIEALPELLAGAERVIARPVIARVLNDALEGQELRRLGARQVQVRVLAIREAIGAAASTWLLPGVVEGQLPRPASPDPLIPDLTRHQINRFLGQPLLQTRDSLAGQEDPQLAPLSQEAGLLLATVLYQAAGRAILFRHQQRIGGLEAAPSALLDPLRAAGLVAAEETKLEPMADAAAAPGQRRLAAILAADPDRAAGEPRLSARLQDLRRRIEAEQERLRFAADRDLPARAYSGLAPSAASLLGPEEVLGVGAVETYLRCPFRFWGTSLLRLRIDRESELELDPVTLGNYQHALAEAVYRHLQEARLLPLDGKHLGPALTCIPAVEAMVAKAWATEQTIGHPTLWEALRVDARRRLAELLRWDARELGGRGYAPLAFEQEFGFGGDSWPALAIEHTEAPILLRGRIDRVDRPAAQDAPWLVVDYKSGKSENHNSRLGEAKLFQPFLQLPAYAAACSQERGIGAGADALFRGLEGGRSRLLSEALASHSSAPRLEDVLDVRRAADAVEYAFRPRSAPRSLGHAVRAAVTGMRAGQFPLDPAGCDYCPLPALCRVEELSPEEQA